MRTVQLSTPIVTHGGTVDKITLQVPLAKLFIDNDDPFQVGIDFEAGQFKYVYANKSMAKFLAAMSGIDDILLERLTAPDYIKLRAEATEIIMSLGAGKDFTEPPKVG